MAGHARRGPNQSVQRALGWIEERGRDERMKERAIVCDACGAVMDFGVKDPQGFGRSMQRCTNPGCDRHAIVPLERVL